MSHRRLPGTYADNDVIGVHGYITTSSTYVYLYIPMIWQSNETSVRVQNLKCSIRTSDGTYLGGAGNIDLTDYITDINIQKHREYKFYYYYLSI